VEKLKLPTSFHSNPARIKFSTGQCVKEVLCDIAPTNSCHLLLRLAWLQFKTLNLDKGSLYLRDEGHEMKLKFMTSRQASKDQHRLKEKIEKERIEKQQIYTVEGMEIEEKERAEKIKMMEKVVEKQGV